MVHIHPIIVHFAIALLAISIITDFLYVISGKRNFWQIANFLLILGTISVIVAVISGNQAYQAAAIPENIEALVQSHRSSGVITMWFFIALSVMKLVFIRLNLFERSLKWLYYALIIIAAVFLFRTGILGGEMVYIHGVGIHKDAAPEPAKPSFE